MKISEARYRANKKWDKANIKHYGLNLNKTKDKDIIDYLEGDRDGLSKNAFLIKCIREYMKREQ